MQALSAKIENFQQVGHCFHSYQLLHIFFVKSCQKANARAKFTSQNLMTGQKLPPETHDARSRISVPIFIRESPPSCKN